MLKKISFVIALILFIAAFLYLGYFNLQIENRESFNFEPYFVDFGNLLFNGFFLTIRYSLIVLVFSFIMGFLFYVISNSRLIFFIHLVNIFSEIVYGTPLLVMISLMIYFIGPVLMISNWEILAILALIFYFTPYMKNVFLAAFSNIGKDQYMAMDLFGFNFFQKYYYIIFPQMIRSLMPPMMSNFSLIVKGSALLSIIGIGEIFSIVATVQSRTFLFSEGYLTLWLLYLLITIPLSQLANWLERKLRI